MIDPTTPEAQHRIKLAKDALYQGLRIKDATRTQLLVVIGTLIQQLDFEQESKRKDLGLRCSVTRETKRNDSRREEQRAKNMKPVEEEEEEKT